MKGQYVSPSGSSALGEHRYTSATEDRVRVLLVESDPDDAQLVCEAFGDVSTETAVDVATDGEEALEFLEQRDEATPVPDLVLLNLELPGMGGLEVLESIRGDGELVHLPVLVLTDSNAIDDVNESYDRAANAYLTKPSDPAAFETIANAIERFWFERASLPPIHS
ncbi:response regulator [Natronococcus pandeyae]|uniref:Response regulator n=1 Tax=Natronococcus pandeyae TaxID=2055836 RepID=A0A8J8QAP9_9EURY|nr:response regulator [Natronococcus pandeyae]TYL40665.1 response regulator [Natronococcus pandeyae]